MSKKVIISKTNFPDMSIYGPEYQVRYRLISEDRNRFSAWTPIFSANPEVTFVSGTIDVPGSMNLEKNTGYVSAVWDDVSIYKEIDGQQQLIAVLPHYDVWIQLSDNFGANPSDWIYKGRIPSTSLNIPYNSHYFDPSGTSQNTREMKVEVYRPGRPVVQDSGSNFLMYSAEITTL